MVQLWMMFERGEDLIHLKPHVILKGGWHPDARTLSATCTICILLHSA